MAQSGPYKLVHEYGYFYVDGPGMPMGSVDRFMKSAPAGCTDPEGWYRSSCQLIVAMLNLAFRMGQNTPPCPSFD